MPYWGMEALGELSSLGALGISYGGMVAMGVQNAVNQWRAGAWLATNPGLAPACAPAPDGTPGCVFDPAHPEELWLTRFDPQAGVAPANYVPTGRGSFLFSGQGSPPWPGTTGPGGGPAPTGAPATIDAVEKVARQGQIVGDAADKLDYSVQTAIQNASSIEGSETSDAESTLAELEDTIAQIHDRIDAIANESNLAAAQSDLDQAKTLARLAKSQAVKAIRAANRAGQVAQIALNRARMADEAQRLQEERQAQAAARAQAIDDARFQQNQAALNQQFQQQIAASVGAQQGFDRSMAPMPYSPYPQQYAPYGYAPQQQDIFLTTPPEYSAQPSGEGF